MHLKVETKYRHLINTHLSYDLSKNKREKRKKIYNIQKISSIRSLIRKMLEFIKAYYLLLMFHNSYFRQEAQSCQKFLLYVSCTNFTSYTSTVVLKLLSMIFYFLTYLSIIH